MKWQDVGGQPDYETIELGDVTSYTDTEVVNGTDTGTWAYEMVAEAADGVDVAISDTALFNTVTGEITKDDSGFDNKVNKFTPTSKSTVVEIKSYLEENNIPFNTDMNKSDLLNLI